MNSPEHLSAGAALGVANYMTSQWAQTGASPLALIIPRIPSLSVTPPATAIITIFCYLIGCLLPDIDQESSWIGRIVHIPVQHRTWTHSIWLPLALALLSTKFWWCLPIALGCIAHLVCDAPSRAGICWLYPYPGYRRYESGAFVKKGSHLWLYKTGEPSEKIVCAAIVIASVLWAAMLSKA